MEDASFLNPLVALAQQAYIVAFANTSSTDALSPSGPSSYSFGSSSSSSSSLPVPVPNLPSNFLCPKGGEGYGPYSTVRGMDLTPCFESLILSIPLGLLLLVGSGSIGWLIRKGEKRFRGGWSAKILHAKLVSVGKRSEAESRNHC